MATLDALPKQTEKPIQVQSAMRTLRYSHQSTAKVLDACADRGNGAYRRISESAKASRCVFACR